MKFVYLACVCVVIAALSVESVWVPNRPPGKNTVGTARGTRGPVSSEERSSRPPRVQSSSSSSSSSSTTNSPTARVARAARQVASTQAPTTILDQIDAAIQAATTKSKSGTPLWDLMPLWFQWALVNQSRISSSYIVKDMIANPNNASLIKWNNLAKPYQVLLLLQQKQNANVNVLLSNFNFTRQNISFDSNSNYNPMAAANANSKAIANANSNSALAGGSNASCYLPTGALMASLNKYPFDLKLDMNVLANLSADIANMLAPLSPASDPSIPTSPAPIGVVFRNGVFYKQPTQTKDQFEQESARKNAIVTKLNAPVDLMKALQSATPNLLQHRFNNLVSLHINSCL